MGSRYSGPSGLAGKLEILSKAITALEFVISHRAPDKPGRGVVFLISLKGPAQRWAAKKAGLATRRTLHSVRVEGSDRCGLGAKLTRSLADAGINLQALSAVALWRRCVVRFAFDRASDADQAVRILKRVLR
jgi:predicted amino acid-binding ACT domain protein